jgi:hypothetical protein
VSKTNKQANSKTNKKREEWDIDFILLLLLL